MDSVKEARVFLHELEKHVDKEDFTSKYFESMALTGRGEVEKLKEREASWQNALQCLEAYLSQFPNQVLLRQMIQVWFSDVKGD